MRLLLAFMVAWSASLQAQETKKKPAAKRKPELQQSAHTAPTPEQLRRFKQLEEKEKQQKK